MVERDLYKDLCDETQVVWEKSLVSYKYEKANKEYKKVYKKELSKDTYLSLRKKYGIDD